MADMVELLNICNYCAYAPCICGNEPENCADYVQRHGVELHGEEGTIQEAIKMVSFPEYTPSADVAPVRHGRWIDLGDNYWERGRTSTRYKCSECGRRAGQKQAKLYHYCPNCGAKMDLDG